MTFCRFNLVSTTKTSVDLLVHVVCRETLTFSLLLDEQEYFLANLSFFTHVTYFSNVRK